MKRYQVTRCKHFASALHLRLRRFSSKVRCGESKGRAGDETGYGTVEKVPVAGLDTIRPSSDASATPCLARASKASERQLRSSSATHLQADGQLRMQATGHKRSYIMTLDVSMSR